MDIRFWVTYYAKCLWNLIYAYFPRVRPATKPAGQKFQLHPYFYRVDLSGSYLDMGVQYGRLLRPILARDVRIWLAFIRKNRAIFKKRIPEKYARDCIFESIQTLYRDNLAHYNPDVLAYMRGVAEGAGLPFTDLLHANLFSDLMDNHCVLLSKMIDGSPMHLRTLDYGTPQVAQCLTVFHPTGRHAYASLNQCYLVGVFTGLSVRGVFFGESYYDAPLDPGPVAFLGTPFHHLAHRLLADADSAAAAVEMLRGCQRQSNLQILLADDASAGVYLASQTVCRRVDPPAGQDNQDNQDNQENHGTVYSVTPNEQAKFNQNMNLLDTLDNVLSKFIPQTKSGELHVAVKHAGRLYVSVTTDVLQAYNNRFHVFELAELFQT